MFRTLPAIVLLLLGATAPAVADYPDRAVRVIVPVAAGGGVDVMARMISQKLSERWGQQFVVENRAGAAGIIGTKAVIGSPNDGYTLLYTPSSLSLTVAVNKTPPYDVEKDLAPIVNVAVSPYALVVHPSVPAKNLQELIAYAKTNPNKLSYSSAGVGSASHLAGELLKTMAGIQMTHVPNKGMNPALIDLLGGQVQVLFASVPAMPLLPDMPTMDESGLKGFEVGNWVGFLAPSGLDPAIAGKLHREIIAIMDSPEMKEKFNTLGFDRIGSTPEEFGATVRGDVDKWSDVVKRAGIPTN
jgi:tripartite-type tricarboxylate transporter receptor subunit TctC